MRRLAALLLALPLSAQAAWPEDVSLSGMQVHQGRQVGGLETTVLAADYERVIRELGAAISTATILPPDTLGVSGFEIAFENQIAFTDTSEPRREDNDGIAPWERVHVDEDPDAFFFAPGMTIRKGLPFSFEVGLTGRWVGNARQGVMGGFVRAAIVEGRKPWPDLNVHVAYTGYVGNDELELGVLDFGGTLGARFRLGKEGTLRSTSLSPYLDVSLLSITAAPLIDADVAADIGAVAFGRRARGGIPREGAIVTGRFSGGLELRVNRFLVRLSGGYTLGGRRSSGDPLATGGNSRGGVGNVAAALGFVY